MISVQEAKKLILENCDSTKAEFQPLQKANGYILAEPVYSPVNTPPFNQSAMDGYAFSFDSWDGKSDLNMSGEIQAGDYFADALEPFETVRIYTGAALPLGADTVVIQENVIIKDKAIRIQDERLVKGNNVRLKGSQTKKGEIALNIGHLLTPPAISFLAGMGIEKVKVFSNPVISIIVTGKELITPGSAISEGKIFESNSFGLLAALNQLNISPFSVDVVDDNEEEIIKIITRELHADILILTGGVSVGDYDFVLSSLEKSGVEKIFHKVKQKPGKPFYFGRRHQTLVFALPGNPAAALTCFYEYVVPAIGSFTCREYLRKVKMPLENNYRKKQGLTYFLKGKTILNTVSVLNNQESYLMNSFAMADCLINLDEEKEQYRKGEMVEVTMII